MGMEALRAAVTKAGFREVRSFLQSGNLVFRSDVRNVERLESSLERTIAKDLGVHPGVFVRTEPEWRTIVSQNPFPREAERDPSHLVITALKDAPAAASWARLNTAIRGPEIVRGSGRLAYIVYPEGIGRSRLTPGLIERELGTRGTSRNWNTILKLGAMAAGNSGR